MGKLSVQTNGKFYRFGFVVEQALGHKTHALNLRAAFEDERDMAVRWVLPGDHLSGLAARIPIYNSNWTVQAGLKTRQGLSRLHKEFPFDGLFFHTQVPAVLSYDWVQRYPSVISLDATPVQYDALGDAYAHQTGPVWLENLKFGLNRRCFHAARHLVTWSQWAKDSLVRDYAVPAEKISVIHPGINLQLWAPPADCQKAEDTIKILFVGGDLGRKGGHELLAAFDQLQKQRAPGTPQLELHLVTQNPVPEQAQVFPHYGLKPNTTELKQLFFTADIFCLPTHGDCLPMVLAEAGAASLPIVSTRVAGIPELVKEGENGFLISPNDIHGLVNALHKLIEDPQMRQSMGLKSRQIVSAEHNVEQNARQLAGILRHVIDSSRQS